MMKRNLQRFMRMVEQKQQQVEAAVKEQEKIIKEQKKAEKPPGEDRDKLESEQCFELFKKRRAN